MVWRHGFLCRDFFSLWGIIELFGSFITVFLLLLLFCTGVAFSSFSYDVIYFLVVVVLPG